MNALLLKRQAKRLASCVGFFFYFTDETNEIQTQVVVNSFRPPVTSFVVYIQFIHHYC